MVIKKCSLNLISFVALLFTAAFSPPLIAMHIEGEDPPLHTAASEGDVDRVRELLEQGADVSAKDRFNNTALHLAAVNGKIKVAELLLEKGADVNVQDRLLNTPLHFIALVNGSPELANLLIDKGAKIDARANKNQTPLHSAAWWGSSEIVDLLIRRGANVDAQDTENKTPLHDAAGRGHLEIVKLLVESGANGNLKSDGGITPLFEAVSAKNNAYDVTKYLLDNIADIDINASEDVGITLLDDAIYANNLSIINLLLDRGADPAHHDKKGITPLHRAVELRQPETVKTLLKIGVDPDIYDNDGSTPLHYAVSPDTREKAIEEEKLTFPLEFPQEQNMLQDEEKEIINLLLEYNANPGYRNLYYQSPLHFAAAWNNLEALELLIDKLKETDNLAPLNYQDRYILKNDVPGSNTALHYAVMNENLPMVQTLVAAGADINKKNARGNTPLNLALTAELPVEMARTDEQKEIARLFLQQEGIRFLPNSAGQSPIIEAFLQLDADDVVNLINRVDDVTIRTPDTGETLLHALPETALTLEKGASSEIITMLVEKGADINAQDNEGNTPLHTAVFVGDYNIVFELLLNGADRYIQNNDGKTPLDVAKEYGADDIVELLDPAISFTDVEDLSR